MSRIPPGFSVHNLPSSSEDDGRPIAPKIAYLQHTNLGPGNKAGPGSRTVHLPNEATPEKFSTSRREPSPDIVWNDDPPLPEINTENYPWLDPEYIHEHDLADMELNMAPPRPRPVSIL